MMKMVLFYLLHSGVAGPELTSTNVSIFITSDAGNTWREVQYGNCMTGAGCECCDTVRYLHFCNVILLNTNIFFYKTLPSIKQNRENLFKVINVAFPLNLPSI